MRSNRARRTVALLPVENTLAGPIDETFDLMSIRDLAIVDETVQPIFHCLIAPRGTALDRGSKDPLAPDRTGPMRRLPPCPPRMGTGFGIRYRRCGRDGDPRPDARQRSHRKRQSGRGLRRRHSARRHSGPSRKLHAFSVVRSKRDGPSRTFRLRSVEDQHLFARRPRRPARFWCITSLRGTAHSTDSCSVASGRRLERRIDVPRRLHRNSRRPAGVGGARGASEGIFVAQDAGHLPPAGRHDSGSRPQRDAMIFYRKKGETPCVKQSAAFWS